MSDTRALEVIAGALGKFAKAHNLSMVNTKALCDAEDEIIAKLKDLILSEVIGPDEKQPNADVPLPELDSFELDEDMEVIKRNALRQEQRKALERLFR